jgi:hypothetical protein
LSPLQETLQSELNSLYDELADEPALTAAFCNMCGSCCNFTQYDHELWLTSLELANLIDKAGHPPPAPSGICPYQKNNRCTARNGRTLGCRIFHCEMDKDKMEKLYQVYLDRIMAICKKHNVLPEYGEMLASLKNINTGG